VWPAQEIKIKLIVINGCRTEQLIRAAKCDQESRDHSTANAKSSSTPSLMLHSKRLESFADGCLSICAPDSRIALTRFRSTIALKISQSNRLGLIPLVAPTSLQSAVTKQCAGPHGQIVRRRTSLPTRREYRPTCSCRQARGPSARS
jgi:hypothetical protein